jgi:outer membrane protein assembly factor BamD
VARFYLTKDNYQAAIARIQYALHTYAPGGATSRTGVTTDSDLEAEALLLLGKTYLKMHKWADARQAFQAIVSAHRQSPLVIPARDYLQHLSEQGA